MDPPRSIATASVGLHLRTIRLCVLYSTAVRNNAERYVRAFVRLPNTDKRGHNFSLALPTSLAGTRPRRAAPHRHKPAIGQHIGVFTRALALDVVRASRCDGGTVWFWRHPWPIELRWRIRCKRQCSVTRWSSFWRPEPMYARLT